MRDLQLAVFSRQFHRLTRRYPLRPMRPLFPEISKIPYEGPSSNNPLAFKHYDSIRSSRTGRWPNIFVLYVAYCHSCQNPLSDPFGFGSH
jgi:xylose isomerase